MKTTSRLSSDVNTEDVTTIIAQFPANDAATASQLFEALLQKDSDALVALCAQLVPQGGGDDNPTRYALTGLARYVSRPDCAEEDRAFVEEALLEGLENTDNTEVQAFLLRQLQQCGSNTTASEIGDLLLDDSTASYAILTLDAIGTHKSRKVLTRALKKTTGLTQLRILSVLANNGRNRNAAMSAESRMEAADANECIHLLSILVDLKGGKAHEDLIAAMDRKEPRCRKAALSHASVMMDKFAAKKWRKKLRDQDTSDAAKREINGLLKNYGALTAAHQG